MSTDTTRICLGAAPPDRVDRRLRHGRRAEFYEDRLGLRAAQEQTDGSRLYASASGASLHVRVARARGQGDGDPGHLVRRPRVRGGRAAGRGVRFERYDDPALRADERGSARSRAAAGSPGSGPRRQHLRPRGAAGRRGPSRGASTGRGRGPRHGRRRSRPVHGALGGGPDVTLFGAWGPIERGAEALRRTFEWVGSRFGGGELVPENVVVHESGDLAHRRLRARHGQRGRRRPPAHDDPGDPRLPPRGREWRLVHRHADFRRATSAPLPGASGKATPSLSTRARLDLHPRATCPARGS